jgi:leader peptidase (prepilin peptidase)/N-methyltransferase
MSGLVWFDALFFALMGLAVGSFANVLIVRTPRQTSILTPASHCPGCDMKLRLWHNIPLLSWLFLRGKCAGCKSPISPIYPAIELGGLGLFLLAGWLGGFHPLALLTSAALVMLLALSVIDARDKMVPDSINFAALFLALAGSGIYLFEHLQAALILAGTLALLRLGLSTLLGREALGEADIILAATLGALLGLLGALLALFIGALLAVLPALILRTRGEVETPFIPFLFMGAIVVLIWGEPIARLWGL